MVSGAERYGPVCSCDGFTLLKTLKTFFRSIIQLRFHVVYQVLDLRAAHPLPIVVSAVELLSFGLALHHGVDGLQVRRVGHQGQSDVPVCDAVDPAVVHPQVVLHVAGALRRETESSEELLPRLQTKPLWSVDVVLRTQSQKPHAELLHPPANQLQLNHLISSFQLGVKLTEDLLQLFTDHVGQNIQTTPERERRRMRDSPVLLQEGI